MLKNDKEKDAVQAVREAFAEGFYSEAAVFPVYSSKGQEPGRIRRIGCGDGPAAEPDGYRAASDAPGVLPDFDWRKKKGLEKLFSPGMLMQDANQDGLSDRLDFKIYLPEKCSGSVKAAACNLAFRFGMETTAYEGELVSYYAPGSLPEDGNAIVFEESGACGIYSGERDGAHRIYIKGCGEELEEFMSSFAGTFPQQPEGRDWTEALKELTDSFAAKNEDGELLMAFRAAKDTGQAEAFVSPRLAERKDELKKRFPQIAFYNYKEKKKVYEKEYDIPWEKEVFEKLLEEKVYPFLKEGDTVILEGALSEDKQVRRKLEEKIGRAFEEKGARAEKCRVLCAYKQGYSWIEEEVLPVLKEKKAAKIKILFKPFLPEGETDWKDENGATPSYHNVKADNPDFWYDLPIRFLQELYPIEDTIVRELGISREDVVFDTYEGKAGLTYELYAWDGNGKEVYRGAYRAEYSERPYLDAAPGMGKVHPSAGYLRVRINGEPFLEERVRTDVENIWDIYQREVLEDCRRFAEEKHPEGIRMDMQPLFSELRLEVKASEPDERLASREDLISTLDALHEDMYFVGTDYFKNYGIRKADGILDAPGLILPILKKAEGKPEFKVTLSEPLRTEACAEHDGQVIKASLKREDVELFMEEIRREAGKTVVILKTNVDNETVSLMAKLISDGTAEIASRISGADILRFRTEDSVFDAEVPEYREPEKNLGIEKIDIMEDRLIGYDDYIKIIEKLKHVPGISVYRTAVSYEGREVYAIELLPKREGYVSRTKRLTLYPSELINGRHHANEVSATNAGLILLKKILTEKKYEGLADRLNLTLVPMENVDGAALHYELQKDNPYWKFHVARFNALGKEFFHEHFKNDTIHTEAHGFTRIWMKMLPDIVVDNHGVPSHEWEQQFSGYTSPSYKGFWLPRSLLYGYFWYVTDDACKSNYPVNKEMEDAIADAVGADKEMSGLNKEWAAQFEKYAHKWMPKLFPADYYKEMIDYWIPFAYDPGHKYTSIRYPWITTVAYTSEVADETAQGSYLNLCARAHVKHDEAVIRMLVKDSVCVIEKQCQITEKGMVLNHTRKRPIVIKRTAGDKANA